MILQRWEEVIYRRYKRMLDEGENLPHCNLILIDGVKGQLSSAVKSLKLLVCTEKIPLWNCKTFEEIFPEDPIPLCLDKKSETLKNFKRVRRGAPFDC